MIKPKTEVPDLEIQLINDTKWRLHAQDSKAFTLLVFYRGLHCPICKNYLEALATQLDDFSSRGVNLIAISSDSLDRAKKTGEQWKVSGLPLGCEMPIETAREWGLFISHGISEKEPEKFTEPALFLVRPDHTLYASSIQTMPFARPDWNDILQAIDFVIEKDYPARGEA